MKIRSILFLYKIIFISSIMLMSGCTDENFAEFISEPYSNTKRLNLIFVDKADPSPSVGIYINSRLLSTNINKGEKGLQVLELPDSLQDQTLSIVLAEFKSVAPSTFLIVEDLIYETFILPSELATLSTIAFSRDNPAGTITAFKSGFSSDEPDPEPGYFKVKFYNISGNKLDVFKRDGALFSEYANLNSLEDRPYIQLPFGFYRFIIRKDNDDHNIDNISPILNGEAGKAYTIFCTDGGQIITELDDFGVPSKTFGYVGFVNLIPNGAQIVALPLQGSSRKESANKAYTKFDGVELVPSGKQTISVEVGGAMLSADYDLKPYDYLMVYVVEDNGKPTLKLIPTPMQEPGLYEMYARFINFSGNADTVTFARIRTDFELSEFPEAPTNALNGIYAANLGFGEIRTTKGTSWPNSVYTPYTVNWNTNNASGAPIIIQAHEATDIPSRLGISIPNTRVNFPFLINTPSQDVMSYGGFGGDPGVYTVILTGKKGEVNPALQSKITIISHSF